MKSRLDGGRFIPKLASDWCRIPGEIRRYHVGAQQRLSTCCSVGTAEWLAGRDLSSHRANERVRLSETPGKLHCRGNEVSAQIAAQRHHEEIDGHREGPITQGPRSRECDRGVRNRIGNQVCKRDCAMAQREQMARGLGVVVGADKEPGVPADGDAARFALRRIVSEPRFLVPGLALIRSRPRTPPAEKLAGRSNRSPQATWRARPRLDRDSARHRRTTRADPSACCAAPALRDRSAGNTRSRSKAASDGASKPSAIAT
ncbi:MAG: hypothetical protein JWN44_2660 [Myxococcales bacterium]|nr:hypothetical protein [Myxococcales bacterium]